MVKKEKTLRDLDLTELRREYMSAVTMLCHVAQNTKVILPEDITKHVEIVENLQSEFCKRFNAPSQYEE